MGGESQTLWLNVTNAALGLVALVCVVVVVGSAAQEIWSRVRGRNETALIFSERGFTMPGLGSTFETRDKATTLERGKGATTPPSAS